MAEKVNLHTLFDSFLLLYLKIKIFGHLKNMMMTLKHVKMSGQLFGQSGVQVLINMIIIIPV